MVDLDSITLDQLRLFVAVAEHGSFSAAGRHLRRAQSAVSVGVASLERSLGVRLFARSGYRPSLTDAGRSLLSDARAVLDGVGALGRRAASVGRGVEPEVRLAVDAICPTALLVGVSRAFRDAHPTVSLRIHTEVLAAVPALVRDGTCQIGIAGPMGTDAPGMERRFLVNVAMVSVAAPGHPLARLEGAIAHAAVRGHVQIVISQRASTTIGGDHGVLSDTTWRVADASTKLDLIRAGLGWGNLSLDMVRDDLDRGRLVRLTLDEWGPEPLLAPLFAVTRSDAPPGPAGQWLLRQLQALGMTLGRGEGGVVDRGVSNPDPDPEPAAASPGAGPAADGGGP